MHVSQHERCLSLETELVSSRDGVLEDCPPPRGQKSLALASNTLGLELHWLDAATRLCCRAACYLSEVNPQCKSRRDMITIIKL